MASKSVGLNMENDCSSEIGVPTEVAVGVLASRRPGSNAGKAEVSGEETGMSTLGAAGVGVQAHGEGSAGITSGRARAQQGVATTCKDLPVEAEAEDGRRAWVWRMSPYERGRRGNALRGSAGRSPDAGNAVRRAKGLSAPGGSRLASVARTLSRDRRRDDRRDEFGDKPVACGVDVRHHLSRAAAVEGHRRTSQGRQPDSGNPTVRDESGGLWKRGPWWNCAPTPQPKGRGW